MQHLVLNPQRHHPKMNEIQKQISYGIGLFGCATRESRGIEGRRVDPNKLVNIDDWHPPTSGKQNSVLDGHVHGIHAGN